MIRNTPNFVFLFSRFAKTVGSSKTIFDFLATDFSEWTRVNSRRIFAVYADLLSTTLQLEPLTPPVQAVTPARSPGADSCVHLSPAIPSGKLTMQPVGTNLN